MRNDYRRWFWTGLVLLAACDGPPNQARQPPPPRPVETAETSEAPATAEAAQGTVVRVTPAEYLAAPGKDVVVLDVRTPAEYQAGHIEGAINIPITDPGFNERAAALDRGDTILVHCAANSEGGRSSRALTELQKQGFPKLQSLVGGYAGYAKAAGQPVPAPAH